MVDKKVSFNIVVGGIPQIKNALRGVTEAARDMNLKVQQNSQNSAQKIIEIERNKLSAIKKINELRIKDAELKAKKIQQVEDQASNKILTIKEREALKLKQLSEKFISIKEREAAKIQQINEREMNAAAKQAEQSQKKGLNLSSLFGSSKNGNVIKMAGQLGIGSEVGEGVIGGEIAGGGLATLGAVAAPVAGALLGIVMVAKALETGFDVVRTQAEYLATSLIGAISQLGGFKNLMEIIIDSAEKEKQIKVARFVVAADEQLSEKQIRNRSESISKRADLGAPLTSDVTEAQKKIGTLTGYMKSVTPNTLEFIAKLAHHGGTSMSEMAEVYGQTWAANKNATQGELQNMLLASVAIGKGGSFNTSELPKAHGLIQAGGMLGGDNLKNTTNALAIGTILRPRSGDLETAGTQYQSFVKAAMNSHMRGLLPQNMNKFFNKNGNITDINSLIAGIASTPYGSRAKPFSTRIESTQFLSNMQKQAGVVDSDTSEQQKEKITKLLESYEKLNMTMDQFNNENTQIISDSDELKASFNNLTDQIGDEFLPILKELTPYVKELTDVLAKNNKMIGSAAKDLVKAMLDIAIAIVPAGVLLAKSLIGLGAFFGVMMASIARAIDEKTGGMFHDRLRPFEEAGDAINESAKKTVYVLDQLTVAFDNLKNALSAPDSGKVAANAYFGEGGQGPIPQGEEGQWSVVKVGFSDAATQQKKAADEQNTAAKALTKAAAALKTASEKFHKQPN